MLKVHRRVFEETLTYLHKLSHAARIQHILSFLIEYRVVYDPPSQIYTQSHVISHMLM